MAPKRKAIGRFISYKQKKKALQPSETDNGPETRLEFIQIFKPVCKKQSNNRKK